MDIGGRSFSQCNSLKEVIIPSNIFVQNEEYILIDQEWQEENVPLEYIMYRAIFYCFNNLDKNYMNKLFQKYSIKPEIFEKLENQFLKSIRSPLYYTFSKYVSNINYLGNINDLKNNNDELIKSNNVLLKEKELLTRDLNEKINENNLLINNLSSKIKEIEVLKNEIHETTNENILLKQENESILNSKRYKFISYIADIKNKLLK